jgi:hypothetical protein
MDLTIWKQLYALIWLAFLQIIIILLPRFVIYLVDVHVLLGLAILGLAHYNNMSIKKSEAPNRLKRIVKSTAVLASIQPILGIILYLNIRFNVAIPFVEVIVFLHLAMALAIITQAASVATAYDMWEEHEFSTPVKPI